ncbi:MAG: hypothetical protein AAFV80_18180 [Bacteroidota bacterium]
MRILLILLILITFFSCIKKECQLPGGGYEFQVPISVSPARDTFAIGDTISVISIFSDEVFERKSCRKYYLPNFPFYPILEMTKIDSSESIYRIEDFFEVIISSSNYRMLTLSDGSQVLLGQYDYQDGIYTLDYKLITRSKGLYVLRQASDDVKNPDQEFEGQCKNLRIDLFSFVNGGGDNNVDMLRDSPDPHFNDWTLIDPERRFHKMGGYCFYVR